MFLYEAVFWVALAPAIRSLRWLGRIGVALTMMAIALGASFPKGQQSLDNPLIQLPVLAECWRATGADSGRSCSADRRVSVSAVCNRIWLME